MNIVWMSWKDICHPEAGGAERVQAELAKRLVADGHSVKIITARHPGSHEHETKDGYEILRRGNRFTVYWHAFLRYRKELKSWANVVIDEMNTVPFFAKFYVRQPSVLLVHQLARRVWFYQMFFPLNLIGFLIEPIYLWLLRKQRVITISESTKHDLMRYGFREENISVVINGVQYEPVANPAKNKRFESPTVLAFGSVRPMKRTLDQVKAFELAKKEIPTLRLKIAGGADSDYAKKVQAYAANSQHAKDIEFLGRVSEQQKLALMQQSHVFVATSVKEGWCLVVTEAASQGTPAVAYDVDGLRDSVRDGKTGFIVKENPKALAEGVVRLLSQDKKDYTNIADSAWSFAKTITQEGSYNKFREALLP